MVHYIVPFPASYSPFHATPLSSCQRTCFEHTTRACFTRGCWHVITKILGFRTLLTSEECVPNKSPQCTNSTGNFKSNFVPISTILIPTFWEISMQRWRGVSKRHAHSSSVKISTIVIKQDLIVICYECLLFASFLNLKKIIFTTPFWYDMQGCDRQHSCFLLKLLRYFWHFEK